MSETNKPVIEIGESKLIELDIQNYLRHIQGNCAEEALLIKRLLDGKMTQKAIGAKIGMSQANVSRRLQLLSLPKKLFERIRNGKLRPSTAYELSKLPENIQVEYVGREEITLKEAKQRSRNETISQDVMVLLAEPTAEVNDREIIVKSLRYYSRNHPRERDRLEKELEKWGI